MSLLRILIGLILVLFILFLLSCVQWSLEGFEDKQTVLDKEIQTYLTLTGDILCPVNAYLLSREVGTQLDKNIPLETKERNAINKLVEEAKGPLFPCPPPTYAISTPADIEDRIRRTMQYYKTKLDTLLNTVQKGLVCQPDEVNAADVPIGAKGFLQMNTPMEAPGTAAPAPTQGFADFNEKDICTPAQLSLQEDDLKKNAALAGASGGRCLAPQDISEADMVRILKQRKDALSRILDRKDVATDLAYIKQRFEQLESVIKAAEKDKLTRTCQL
jgi:hypothetical protein